MAGLLEYSASFYISIASLILTYIKSFKAGTLAIENIEEAKQA